MIRALIDATLPAGWSLHYTRTRGGYCYDHKREMHIPRPRHGYRSLWVYFHELGHALRMDAGRFRRAPLRDRLAKNNPGTSFEEFMAECHAIDMLTHFGFPITPTELHHARSNVRAYVTHEDKLGLQVHKEARDFAASKRRRAA